jgi:iron complex transport system substrate-binding protein
MRALFFLMLGAVLTAAADAAPASRVVTLAGSVTEIVYALGEGARLVGVDSSSLYPPAATRLPTVGYYRAVPVEGVLALAPDLVLASEQAGPPEALRRLAKLGLRVVTLSDAPSLDSLKQRVRGVAQALGVAPAGEILIAQISAEIARVQRIPSTQARAVLLVNRNGTPQGAGRDTAANEVLKLAGLVNVLQDQSGYKPVSAEALLVLAPELIVVTSSSLEASGGVQALLRLPGVMGTPAGIKGRVVVMDDLLLLGLGPRLAQALGQLKQEAARVMAR